MFTITNGLEIRGSSYLTTDYGVLRNVVANWANSSVAEISFSESSMIARPYTITSSPENRTNTSITTGLVRIHNLTPGTTYFFTLSYNIGGVNLTATSNTIVMPYPQGEVIFSSTWFSSVNTIWIVPEDVTNISVLCVGAGGGGNNYGTGGGGGALVYRNNVTVTPGQIITINAGMAGQNDGTYGTTNASRAGGNANVTIAGVFTNAGGGLGGRTTRGEYTVQSSIDNSFGAGGIPTGTYTAGYSGGKGGNYYYPDVNVGASGGTGGGGAAGYAGNGGRGSDNMIGPGSWYAGVQYLGNNATDGNGGGGGGGGAASNPSARYQMGGPGGGVGLFGQGNNGTRGVLNLGNPGSNGGGGSDGGNGAVGNGETVESATASFGGSYGGGGGGLSDSSGGTYGGNAAVRIVWIKSGGSPRTFPSNNVGNITIT